MVGLRHKIRGLDKLTSCFQKPTSRSAGLLVILMAASLAGNYFKFSFLLGVDFLFGSIAVWLVLYLYGMSWGILAAILSSTYTYILWHHPYGIFLFTCEALFVGMWLHRKSVNLVLLVGIYWLLIGMPLVVLFYLKVLHFEAIQMGIILLKDAVNGIFNALIASLILTYLPLPRWTGYPLKGYSACFHTTLFDLLVAFVFFPTLLLTMADSRREVKQIEADIKTHLEQRSAQLVGNLRLWYQQHLRALNELAQMVAGTDMIPSPELQRSTKLVKETFPDFHAVYIANSEGTTLAFYPPTDEQGKSTLGLNFSDRPYFKELKATLRPVISEVFLGRVGAPHPITTIAVPILVENNFRGFTFGALELSYLGELLRLNSPLKGLQATLVDRNNRVIATTLPDYLPLQVFDRRQKSKEIRSLDESTHQWLPIDKNIPAMENWKKSFYLKETPLGEDIPWILIGEEALAPYQDYLQGVYIKRFVVILILATLAFVLSTLLSRRLANPLSRLAEVTTDLPHKLLNQETIKWPNGLVVEMNSLINNFQLMIHTLRQNFQEVQQAKEKLEERTQELSRINRELEAEIHERKRVEEALRENEKRLRLALEANQMGTWDWNISTGEVTWSESMASVFGIPLHAFEGTYEAFLNFVYSEDRESVIQATRQAIQGGVIYNSEFRIVRPDGTVRWITDRGQVFYNEGGHPLRMVGVSADVTERKQAERRLAAQYGVSRTLAESTTLGDALPKILRAICESLEWRVGALWRIDHQANVLRCEEVWHISTLRVTEFEAVTRKITFSPGVGLPGRIWASGEPAWIPDVVKDPNFPRAAVAAKEGLHGAFGFPIRLGSEILGVVEFFSSRIEQPDKDLLEVIASIGSQIGQFIERKRVEKERAQLLIREHVARTEAEESKKRLEFLAEASKLLASSLDYPTTLTSVVRLAVPYLADWCAIDIVLEDQSIRHLEVAHVDPMKVELARALQQRYPVDPDLPYGTPKVLRTHQSEIYPEIPDSLLLAIAQDAEHLKILQELGLKSAMIVPLLIRGRAIGTITFVSAESGRQYGPSDLALAEELAHRAANAIDNAKLFHEIQEANRRKDEFLAMLAHELRNPLAPIQNTLHLMTLRSENNLTLKQSIDLLERQIRHMARLLDDLLDVSRITRGKVQLQKELLNLSTVITQAVETSRPFIESRKHQLLISLPSEPLWLEADPVRLEQVFVNLLNNAAKYTDIGGRIWLKLEKEGNEAILRVRDTGIGISPEMLPRVFDLFTQANNSLDRSQGGLGIGLTLVRSLVEMHGGSVSAYSAGLGQGSEFVVRLPILSGTQGPGDVETQREEDSRTARSPYRRILVVDDNIDAAMTLSDLLKMWGYEVQTVHNGLAALEITQTYQPDVVLLDIGLPEMDGYEVAQQLRQKSDKIILIALTGYGQEEDRRRSQEAGFNYHFTKPVNLTALQSILNTKHQEFL